MHPDKQGQALVLAVEPITNGDGAKKNDGEREAVKRLLDYLGEAFPARRFLITEDALASIWPASHGKPHPIALDRLLPRRSITEE